MFGKVTEFCDGKRSLFYKLSLKRRNYELFRYDIMLRSRNYFIEFLITGLRDGERGPRYTSVITNLVYEDDIITTWYTFYERRLEKNFNRETIIHRTQSNI